MIENYKVYKAVVVDVIAPSKDGKRKREIIVSPRHNTGEGPQRHVASPPSWLPTSIFGSGVVSFPDKGQECLVAEGISGERHIISYTQPKGISPYGNLLPSSAPAGGVSFGIKGLEESTIFMDRKGTLGLFSNHFAQIKVIGGSKTVLTKGFNIKSEFAGGKIYHLHDNLTDLTKSTSVFTKKYDNPGFSDQNMRTEEGYSVEMVSMANNYTYADKTIIKSGDLPDNTAWNLETRQNVQSSPTGKDVVTNLRVGYQKEFERFPNYPEFPEGSVLEWTAKTNIPNNISTYVNRFGKLKTGPQKGEIYRFSIVEGINDNKLLGNKRFDPLGEGEGYEYSKNSSSLHQFSQSFGYLPDSNDEEEKKSIFREYIHHKAASETIFSKKLLGGDLGDLVYRKSVGVDNLILENTLSRSENGEYTLKYVQNNEIEGIKIKNGEIELKTSKNMLIRISKEEILLKMKDSELKLTESGLSYNGKALVFETFIEFMENHQNSFVMGNMQAPAPLFPATLAEFTSTKARGHKTPHGFTTKS